MVKNFIIEAKKQQLQKKRAELGKRHSEIQSELSIIGIPTSKVRVAHRFADERTIERRRVLAAEIGEVRNEIMAINIELRKLHDDINTKRNVSLIKLFNEIFTEDQIKMLYAENNRRLRGEQPIKVRFDWKNLEKYKEDSDKYRTAAKEQLEKMIQFRIMLTGIVEQGCNKWGDAEFLKFISPLNRLIIPLQELEKIKRTLNF